MKRLFLSFLTMLLLGCSLAWADQVTVRIHGTITAPANLPDTLKVWVGNAASAQLEVIALPAASYDFTATVNAGSNVYFNLGGANAWALYGEGGEPYRTQDFFFETEDGLKNRFYLRLVDPDNPFEEEKDKTDYTVNLKIVPKDGGGGDAKATLVGRVDRGTGSMDCLESVSVAISNTSGYSAQTTTQFNYTKYWDKVKCNYGYEFTNLELGTYTLTYTKSGYETKTQQVEITEAGEKVAPAVTLVAEPVNYLFEGHISYLDRKNDEVKVEGAKITAYDGPGANANILGTATTDAQGHWTMTLACQPNATVYFFAEHPNIVVNNRTDKLAEYQSGNTVTISCEEKLAPFLPMDTYKVKQTGTKEITVSWTWPQALIDNYKTSETSENDYMIDSVVLVRWGWDNTKTPPLYRTFELGAVTGGYTLPGTSFIDNGSQKGFVANETCRYEIAVYYHYPKVGSVRLYNDGTEHANEWLTTVYRNTPATPSSVTLAVASDNTAWGTVSQSGSGTYDLNDLVVIRATPKKGYLFKEWQKDGATYATTAEYTFALTENMSLTAVFEARPVVPVTVTLKVNDAKMGTVSQSGNGTYNQGDEVTITATPNAGYVFKHWKTGTAIFSQKSVYTFIAESDSTVTAVFERETLYEGMINGHARQVSATSVRLDWEWPQYFIDDYKQADGSGLYEISQIDIRRREVNPNDTSEYHDAVTVGTIRTEEYTLPVTYYLDDNTEEPLVKNHTYSYFFILQYTAPANREVNVNNKHTDAGLQVTIIDNVEPVQYYIVTLNTNGDDRGTVSGAGDHFLAGDKVTVKASAKAGYVFIGWKEGGTVVSKEISYTFTVEGNRTLTAEFVPESEVTKVTLTLNVNDAKMGTVSAKGTLNGEECVSGASVTVTARPATGYMFVAWKEGETEKSTSAVYTFEITANTVLTAVFAPLPTTVETYTVTLICDETMGTVSGNGDYSDGAQATVTATPKPGYIFKGWQENGEMLNGVGATYTFFVSRNRTLTAVFSNKVEVKLLVNNANMGTVEGEGQYTIGEEVTVKAIPNPGYLFQRWTAGQTEVSTEAEYKLVVRTDTTLMAVFIQDLTPDMVTFKVEVNDEAMGTATIVGVSYTEGEFLKGARVTVKAEANEGYRFRGWDDGERIVSTEAEYTFTLEEDLTLTAVFAQGSIVVGGFATLKIEADETMGTVEGAGRYAKGAEVTVKATPNPGYEFVAWKAGETEKSTEAEYTFTIEEDLTLTAVFVEGATDKYATVKLEVNDETMGMVTGAGRYEKGIGVTVKAIPYLGYIFQAWKNGDEVVETNAEYTFSLTEDVTLTAVFVPGNANEHLELADWSVYVENGRIVLRSNTACRYEVYTVSGVLVNQGRMDTDACSIAVDHSGLYMVRRISATGISVKKVVVR